MKDVWRAGNEIELLINGEAFFPRVFDSIRKAKREVLIETFIIREDEVGKALQQTLMYVARRGVHVEITVDAYGGNDASAAFFPALADAGVTVELADGVPSVLAVSVFESGLPSGVKTCERL